MNACHNEEPPVSEGVTFRGEIWHACQSPAYVVGDVVEVAGRHGKRFETVVAVYGSGFITRPATDGEVLAFHVADLVDTIAAPLRRFVRWISSKLSNRR